MEKKDARGHSPSSATQMLSEPPQCFHNTVRFENTPGRRGQHGGILAWRSDVRHARLTTEAGEGFDGIAPTKHVTAFNNSSAAGRGEFHVRADALDGVRERLVISRRNDDPESMPGCHFGYYVAPGADDRQAGPDAVQQAGAVSEAALEICAMGAHRRVTLRKISAALSVRNVVIEEVHGPAIEWEFVCECTRFFRF
jgi:hypothetical protein